MSQYLPEQCLTPESIKNGARAAYELYREQVGDETLPDYAQLPSNIKQQRETQFAAFAHKGPGANEPGDPFEKICAQMVRRVREAVSQMANAPVATEPERQIAPPTGPGTPDDTTPPNSPDGAQKVVDENAPPSTPPVE